ncbi:unnamed protein product [Closterium sp. Naga37s-1]|nr:unnamed protein product [Closterium sp. Naga37s-1]CAI5999893.1 unnamed protein product [Closterium sp. NIES-65]
MAVTNSSKPKPEATPPEGHVGASAPSNPLIELFIHVEKPRPYDRVLLVRKAATSSFIAGPSSESEGAGAEGERADGNGEAKWGAEGEEAKEAEGSGRGSETGRALEVHGLPCRWRNERKLRAMFAKFGDVSRVIVEGDDTDGSRLHHSSSAPSAAPSAVVVFARPESLRRLLKSASLSASSKASLKAKAQAKATITDPDSPMQGGEADGDGEGKGKGQAEGEEAQQPLWPAWGMEGWLNAYADERPGLAHLQAEADAYISEYEDRLERERREAEERALRSQEDDGWTVVRSSSASRRNRDPSSGVSMGVISKARAQVLAVKLQQKQKKQQAAAAEALKFYRFQHREARRQELMELQKKFDSDRKRIAKLRDARKFRPY